MKNLLVVCVTTALLYLGYDAIQPVPPPAPAPAPAPAVAMATPAPIIAPKVYFHSALDAPAMPARMTTGTGYFSTDPNSRFVAGYGYSTSGSHLDGGSTTYIVVPGGGSVASPGTSRAAAAGQTQPSPRVSYLRKDTPKPTPNPAGTVR